MIRKILFGLVVVVCGAVLVLMLGAYTSLDHERTHTRLTDGLPAFSASLSAGTKPVLVTVRANGMTFRARAAGFAGNAGNVLLLHGFPETSIMYADAMPKLAEAGYRVLAFDQRGYSPGARPTGIDAYGAEALIADVQAVADAVGFERYHLVGHDWGAAVGWLLVMQDASRVTSWTSLSIPHLVAYGEAIQTDPDQQRRSRYIGLFRMPWVPEILFTFNRLALLRGSIYAEHPAAEREEYLAVFSEPGALSAALNWYRAVELRPQDAGVLFEPGPEVVEEGV